MMKSSMSVILPAPTHPSNWNTAMLTLLLDGVNSYHSTNSFTRSSTNIENNHLPITLQTISVSVPAQEYKTERREQAAKSPDLEFGGHHRAGGGEEPASYGSGY